MTTLHLARGAIKRHSARLRSAEDFNGLVDVTTENPVRDPCSRPTHREIPDRQEHEAGTRKLPGGRVTGGTANQGSSVGRIAQLPHERGSIVDGAVPEIAKGVRAGGGDDQAARLGQRDDADKPRNRAQ